MKKIRFILTAGAVAGTLATLSGCSYRMKEYSQQLSYKDPQTVGGYWNVTSNGITFPHLKCTYWGINDDTSVFKDENGKIYIFSGTCAVVQDKD